MGNCNKLYTRNNSWLRFRKKQDSDFSKRNEAFERLHFLGT